jgi:DNA-binding beta-propeller fold protein YncE
MSTSFIHRMLVAVPLVALMLFAKDSSAQMVHLTLKETIQVPDSDSGFDFASIDAASNTLYIGRGTGVMSVNLNTKEVTSILVPGKHTNAVVGLPQGRLLATNEKANTVTLAEAKTGHIITTTPTGTAPDAAAYDPSSGLVFVMCEKGNILAIDPKTGKVAGKLRIKGDLEYVVADGQGRLFINVNSTGEIAVIDTAALKEVARYKMVGCKAPTGLALDPESGILVSSCENGKAFAVRAKDGTTIGSVPIDRLPDAVIFDKAHKTFWIPCGRDGTMVAVAENGDSISLAGKVTTSVGAHTGALDPTTGNIYLPTAEFGIRVTPPGFTMKPGTFRILVFGN